jgi:hypothetical protein
MLNSRPAKVPTNRLLLKAMSSIWGNSTGAASPARETCSLQLTESHTSVWQTLPQDMPAAEGKPRLFSQTAFGVAPSDSIATLAVKSEAHTHDCKRDESKGDTPVK